MIQNDIGMLLVSYQKMVAGICYLPGVSTEMIGYAQN